MKPRVTTNSEAAEASQEILFLSDLRSDTDRGDATATVVADRERAAAKLDCGQFAAICLDRSEVAHALSDANWLRQHRNELPVLAVVEAEQVPDATRLLSAGVGEILVRGQGVVQDLSTRLELLTQRDGSEKNAAATEGLTLRSTSMRRCLEGIARAQRSEASVLL